MADDKKKIAEDIEKDISKLEASLSNLAGVINDRILNKLSDTKDKTREWLNEFEKGKDISKQVSAKLSELQRESNKLALNRIKLETDLARAQKSGLNIAERKIREALRANQLAEQEIDKSQTALYNLQQKTEEYKKQNSLGNKLNNILNKSLGSAKDQVMQFFSLAGIIAIIVDGVGKMDKQIIAMSKSLGISRESAQKMRNEMAEYAASSKDGFATIERLYKAQQALSEQLGVAVEFSNEERENFARLTELVGLTNEEAAGLARNATITGKSTTEYLASVRNATFEAQRANKIRISDKELLSTISKLSTGILVKFKGNTDALAKAVVQAKKLGLTLEQVDKIGDSMLDFEQSIEKELEAELITGRQLNFERARAAALTGDQAALMEELNAQVGSLEDFQNMNVVAQRSLAEAFGMSREEMTDMLTKQKLVNDYGEEAAKLNEEQIEDMKARGMNAEQYTKHLQDQRDIQAKFNDLMTRLQEQIVALVGGPLGDMAHVFLDVLNILSLIFVPIRAIFDFTQYIGNAIGKWMDKLGPVGKLLKGIASIAIVYAAYQAYGSLSTIPVVGPVLGGIAAAAITAAGFSLLNSQKANDMVSEGGYGKRTLLAPEGAIKLNDKDTVIAGTNLGGGGGNRGGGGGESMGMVVAAIKDLQNSISKLASRPITVSLDGEKVGTMVGRRNETGTEQVKNSYSLA